MKPNKVLTIDIETSGLDPWRDTIYMVGLYDGETYTCCRTVAEYQSAMANYADWALLGHNAAFDLAFLVVQGWDTDILERDVHDTQLMAHVCTKKVPKAYLEKYEEVRKEKNAELPKGVMHRPGKALSLKVLAPWFLKVKPFWENPANHDDEQYNRTDCVYTRQLWDFLWKELEQIGLEFYLTRMRSWAKMLLQMRLRGIPLDMSELEKAEAEYHNLTSKLKAELDEMWAKPRAHYIEKEQIEICKRYADMASKAVVKAKDKGKTIARYEALQDAALQKVEPLNYSSPVQMKWLLKDYLGLDVTKLDDDDEESTGKAVLHKLADTGREDIKKFLEYRAADKIATAFLPTYKELQVDGILHPTFNITGTRTGRTSSSNPNLQQVPAKLYRLFKPSHNHRFIIYDLSGIEAALIALYSGDGGIYNILQSGDSIHDHNAKILFDLEAPVTDIKKHFPRQRQCAKNLGFATFYGAGWRRLQVVFSSAGFQVTDEQAKQKLNNLKRAYKDVFQFHKDVTDIAAEGGILDNLFGRPIAIPDPEDAYMKAFNTLVQSSASDLNLRACEKAQARWAEAGLQAAPLLVIHDCIVAEAHKDHVEKAERILVDAMTGFKLESANGPIRLQVEGGISDRWEK